MKKKQVIVLGISLFLIMIIAGGYFLISSNNRQKQLEEQNETLRKKEEALLSNDFYTKALKNMEESKKYEQEKETESAESAKEYNSVDSYQLNFYSAKKEILDIKNIKSSNSFSDSLLTSMIMFLNYYDVSISKNDLIQYLSYEKPTEKNGEMYGTDSTSSCIGGNEYFEYESYCLQPFINTALQNILNDYQSNEYVQSAQGFNLNYSVLDIPTILWVGKDYQEAKDSYEWYSFDKTEKYKIPKDMRVVLLVGYDQEHFYINDPTKDEVVKVERELLEKSYDSYGRQQIRMYRGRNGLFK